MFNPEYYMRQVLAMASTTNRQTLPNPQVAALVVKDSHIVGLGCHLGAGQDHAEKIAIEQAGIQASGATLYINLEPCAHFGKTPPCTELIIKSGIKHVIIATLDPNPLVAGKGIAKLKSAGITVTVGILSVEASLLNEVFFHNITTQLPFVTLKVAMSLDGKIASKTNDSQWITCIESRTDSHSYRNNHDAILIGVNTLLADDPLLSPYLAKNPLTKPIKIILDSHLRTPLNAKVLNNHPELTWIYTTVTELKSHQPYVNKGARIIVLDKLLINDVLKSLFINKIYSLYVEGGEQIYASFIEARRINQLVSYISPQLIGSKDAKHFFAGEGFATLANSITLELRELKQIGKDIKVVSVPKLDY